MLYRFCLFLLVLLFLFSSLVLADEPGFIVHVEETGFEEKPKVISYYDEYYVANVEGEVTVKNNFNSTVYNVVVPFDLNNLNIFEKTDTDYIKTTQLEFSMFDPFEEKTFKYHIRGVTPGDPMSGNKGVFESAVIPEKASLQPLLISKVHKAEIEDEDIDTHEVKRVEDRRVVTVRLENPTDSPYNITRVDVLKSPPGGSLEEDEILNRWSFPEDGSDLILEPHSNWERDIADYNASPNEVYWLDTNVDTSLDLILDGVHNITRYTQEDLIVPENITEVEEEDLVNVTDYMTHLMYAKKSYSETHVNPGDIIDVEILLNNFAPVNRNVTIEDFIPRGFRLVSENDSMETFQNVTWDLLINPDSSETVNYQLEYVEEDLLGVDYFEPAIVRYEDEKLMTQRTPFVRKYIPDRQIFVQKKISSTNNSEYKVEIKVQNVGESSIDNLYIKEFLESDDVFREITKVPEEKGFWLIPEIDSDSEWEVSYITDKNDALYSLPGVIGIDDDKVLRTLILESFVEEQWVFGGMALMEKIGIFVVVVSVFGLIFYSRYRRGRRERTFKKFQSQIDKLKKETAPSPEDSIDYLKETSTSKTDYPDVEWGIERGDSSSSESEVVGIKQGVSEDINKREAKENIEELKKLHSEVEKEK
ncbi:MAG: hypothetical protein ACOCZ6_01980 [Nanoarchaeota archaeon]